MASFIFRLPEKYLIYCNHSVFLLPHGFGIANAIPLNFAFKDFAVKQNRIRVTLKNLSI